MPEQTQLTHKDHTGSDKKFPLSILVNDMNSPLNVGSLFRLCDALGIEKLYLCGDTVKPPNSKIKKTSRSTEEYIDYEFHNDAVELAVSLKKAGSRIISLEMTNASIDINSDQFRESITEDSPVCLVLGSENTGVKDELLSLSDMTAHIVMHGNNSSMNVVTAAAISCYQITQAMAAKSS